MKNLIKFLLVLVTLTVTLVSCKKAPLYPTNQLPANIPKIDTASMVGGWGQFVIVDAVMYVENKETGAKTKYQHFSPTKSRSSLRWDGSQFDIENIIKDTTTYSFWKPLNFPGIGKFVLNDDTTHYYGVQYTGMYRTIVEDPTHGQQNIGGSARPFSGQTISVASQTIAIEIEEMEGSINGYNCRYWTQLTLRKIKSW